MGVLEKIKDIELEISRTQKNKHTEYHVGLLKGKLARYRSELVEMQKGSTGGQKGDGFEVAKAGNARVAMVGLPSVGKSTLLNQITDTKSCVAAYEFTTLCCIPGVIQHNGAKIQLLDLPGIIAGAAEGKGRGKQVIATAKTADLLLMIIDASQPDQKRILTDELINLGIRVNCSPPNIQFHIKQGGGIHFASTCYLTHLDERLVYGILQDFRIFNAEIVVHEDATVDQFVDLVQGTCLYLPCLYVYNKIDTLCMEEVDRLARQPMSVVISAELSLNLDRLIMRIWRQLDLIRVYTKKPSQNPQFNDAIILKPHSTIEDVCCQVHRSLLGNFKYALVWGRSVKYSPQRVSFKHVLQDQDVVQIVKRVNM
nr:developmentally-regulated GTP-binding protein 2 [Paratrimastix eleionoma]